MIRCDTCPYCKDTYPGKTDSDGNHFCICGMTGNMVYTEPRRVKKWSGSGYLKYGISSCGIFETVDDALANMTEIERKRWRERNHDGNHDQHSAEVVREDPDPGEALGDAEDDSEEKRTIPLLHLSD